MKQLTKEETILFAENELWKDIPEKELAEFIISQKLLCVPLEVMYETLSKALGRPVYTHEFAYPDHLLQELKGDKPRSTFEDIINLIPTEKRIIIPL